MPAYDAIDTVFRDGEPIARHGPFVMNTRAEIEEALRDLRTGHFIRADPRNA